jgi:electron transport complex protein RnfA
MSFTDVLLMMFGAVLIENFIFAKFYGCCPFLGVSEKPDTALGMGMAVTFVMTLSSAVTWLVYQILVICHIEYFQTIAFILVIAALVQFIEMFLRKFIPSLYSALGIYLPLITTNCAVLSSALINIQNGYNFIESMVSSLGVGLGFLHAMVLFAGVRSRIENCPSPESVKGLPITLIAASIVSLAFYGFGGVIESLLA